MLSHIFHITQPLKWEKAIQKGSYKPESLKKCGSIHCVKEDQLLDIAKTFFQQEDTELIISNHIKI
jgi:uncharacterized protein (DUF952 family)